MEDKRSGRVYRRKVTFTENVPQKPKSADCQRKEVHRPRSRSLYTTNSYMNEEIINIRDFKPYEGLTWQPRLHNKTYYVNDYASDIWNDDTSLENNCTISPQGIISLRLHNRVRVDISLDKAVRVVNYKSGIVLALSPTGSSAALLHPNGRVYQYGSRVEILAHDSGGNNKYAKMWYKGVSFTSDQCALVYLVDSAGTRTTTDSFSDLTQDFSLNVFYSTGSNQQMDASSYGAQNISDAITVVQSSNFWATEDGTENWIINNVRISQTCDGLVRIGRNSNKFSLRTSPTNGSASVSSPFLHCTGSLGQTRHLFVRRGERRMHYDGSSFIVRNAGHSAGFDEKHQLKVY